MNKDKENSSIVYHHDVIEFVTVAVQFCVFMESAGEKSQGEFVSTSLKLLPLLYLKGLLLPKLETIDDIVLEQTVTEENYDIVRHNIAYTMGSHDDYLDVFVEDMKYSDQPVVCTVSENLADVYQDVKNFIGSYRTGVEDVMQQAISECKENFEHYWGQRVVNVMRSLHEICFNHLEDDADDEHGHTHDECDDESCSCHHEH